MNSRCSSSSRRSVSARYSSKARLPLEAARRELAEETRLEGLALDYAVQFGGLTKLHHVFVADVPAHLTPRASNEIARCKWFTIDRLDTLRASVPTRKIIELLRLDCFSAFASGPLR